MKKMSRYRRARCWRAASPPRRPSTLFEYGGRTITIDPDRGTVSIPGVYDNTGKKAKRPRGEEGDLIVRRGRRRSRRSPRRRPHPNRHRQPHRHRLSRPLAPAAAPAPAPAPAAPAPAASGHAVDRHGGRCAVTLMRRHRPLPLKPLRLRRRRPPSLPRQRHCRHNRNRPPPRQLRHLHPRTHRSASG